MVDNDDVDPQYIQQWIEFLTQAIQSVKDGNLAALREKKSLVSFANIKVTITDKPDSNPDLRTQYDRFLSTLADKVNPIWLTNFRKDIDDEIRKVDKTNEFTGYDASSSSSSSSITFSKKIETRLDAIEEFNKFCWFGRLKGKVAIITYEDKEYVFWNEAEFRKYYRELKIKVDTGKGDKFILMADVWLDSQLHRRFKQVIFDPDPNYAARPEIINLFQGFDVKPIKGVKRRSVLPWARFMFHIICNKNYGHFRYFNHLIADMRQRPHKKPGVIVVLQGEEGIGKSICVETIGRLMRPAFYRTSNADSVFGNWNDPSKDCIMLHFEEAVWAGSHKTESQIKDLATGETREIRERYVSAYTIENHVHIFLTGNPEHQIAARMKARRIFALNPNESRRNDHPYFGTMLKWLDDGGLGMLARWYDNISLDGIELRNVPKTAALMRQKRLTSEGVLAWWYDILQSLEAPYGTITGSKEAPIVVDKDGNVIDGCQIQPIADKYGRIVGHKITRDGKEAVGLKIDGHEHVVDENFEMAGDLIVIKKYLYWDYMNSYYSLRHKMGLEDFGRELTPLLPNGGKDQKGKTPKARDSHGVRHDAYYIKNGAAARRYFDQFSEGPNEWNIKKHWSVARPDYPAMLKEEWDKLTGRM